MKREKLLLLLLGLAQLLHPSSGALTFRKGQTYRNTDFWFMPNDYSVSARVIPATYRDDQSCAIVGNLTEIKDNILFFALQPFLEAGCFDYGQTIDAITSLKPAVSIFETDNSQEDFGHIYLERYGNLPGYEKSGLALTLVHSTTAKVLLEEVQSPHGDLMVTITADVGSWVRYGSSAGFQAFRGIFIVAYSLLSPVFGYQITMALRSGGRLFTKPIMIGIFGLAACILRILELAVDPFFLLHTTPYWCRLLLYWAGFFSAYISFIMIAVIMVEKGNRQRKPWVKKFVTISVAFLYFTIGHLAFFGILDITSMAYRDNQILPTVLLVVTYLFAPCVLVVVLSLFAFGFGFMLTVHRALSVGNRGTFFPQSKSFFWLIACVTGILTEAVCVVLATIPTLSLSEKMGSEIATECAALWCLLFFTVVLSNSFPKSQKQPGSDSEMSQRR